MLLRVLPLVFAIGCGAVADSPSAVVAPVGFNPTVSFAPLVESVSPAVVSVYVNQIQQIDPRMQRWFGLPSEREVEGQGSGFVISPDGYLLTNRHVADGAETIKVKFPDGTDYEAKVVGVDELSDVALLKIDAGRSLPFLRLSEDPQYRVGDWVIAVGNPLGMGHTVTQGILSGVGRNIGSVDEFLQTDAAINPGNSGGPLIAMDGAVVGMNTAIIQGANTVGFAIPSDHLARITRQLRENGRVSRGYLGIQMAEVPENLQKALGKGVVVDSLAEDGPAGKAGLKAGDLITNVDGKAVESSSDLLRAVAGHTPGDKVQLTLMREGKQKSLDVTLAERPKAEAKK